MQSRKKHTLERLAWVPLLPLAVGAAAYEAYSDWEKPQDVPAEIPYLDRISEINLLTVSGTITLSGTTTSGTATAQLGTIFYEFNQATFDRTAPFSGTVAVRPGTLSYEVNLPTLGETTPYSEVPTAQLETPSFQKRLV